jgi:hypothetical protein
VVADDVGRRLTSAASPDRGLEARSVPVVDVEPGGNGYESATAAPGDALRSGRRARVDSGGDGGSATTVRSPGVAIDAFSREPDLDRFTAALLALALHELDQERNGG